MQRRIGLSSDALKLFAMACMLSDHLWATVIPGNSWMTCVGRLAFPIFAFLIAEGFVHTSHVKRYAWRLFIFALISEIPFNFIMAGSAVFPFHQNVMFTLLLGLLCLCEIERFRKIRTGKAALRCMLTVAGLLLLSLVGFVDYGVFGVLTVVAFYLLRDFRGAGLCRLVALILLNIVFFKGQMLTFSLFSQTVEFSQQGFAVLSMIPIALYNGTKAKTGKWVQYAFYAFYPVHMALIYLVYRLWM